MYLMLKHTHLMFIALSVLAYAVRFIFVAMESRKADNKALKIGNMVLLTLVIVSGVGLSLVTGQYPFSEASPWLTEKVMAFVAYVFLVLFALKYGRTKTIKVLAFLGSIGWLFYIANLVMSRQPMLLG